MRLGIFKWFKRYFHKRVRICSTATTNKATIYYPDIGYLYHFTEYLFRIASFKCTRDIELVTARRNVWHVTESATLFLPYFDSSVHAVLMRNRKRVVLNVVDKSKILKQLKKVATAE